ncbi:hypothetical protein OG559_19470 [Micromonospora sp. NBC_01405]
MDSLREGGLVLSAASPVVVRMINDSAAVVGEAVYEILGTK